MEQKRDIMEPSNPRRQRELDTAIQKHFHELRRLLNEQRKDLEVLRSLQTAEGSMKPSADSDLAYLIQHRYTLPEHIRRQVVGWAKTSGVSSTSNDSTIREEPK